MYLSKLFVPIQREDPKDAETISHKLMIKGGLIRQISSGIYAFLPIGFKVLKKVENIIREEMNKIGAQEVILPALLPREPWDETGRWDIYGDELFRLKDRRGRDFCLGPTHEEIITMLVRNSVRSYKNLPQLLYQIQTKFRDEIRPRFGIMRSREFLMKDLYSFDSSWDNLSETYKKVFEAYKKIFDRFKLKYYTVEADSGAIGGKISHEFVAESSIGECEFVVCSTCGYAANIEAAKSGDIKEVVLNEEPLELVYTPNMKKVEEVSKFLNLSEDRLIKAILYIIDEKPILVLIRGDDEINEVKLKNFYNAKSIRLADENEIERYTKSPLGFSGPIGYVGEIIADTRVKYVKNGACGGNKKDHHYIHVSYPRDFDVKEFIDLRKVRDGDPCPKCGEKLIKKIGIELGHTFQLGTKYSESMKAYFQDENGELKPFIMGCYGIGLGRIIAATIEQYSDKKGIVWTNVIAPYHIIVIPVSQNIETAKEAENFYFELLNEGFEVLFEDRDISPGEKFKDADLIGIPYKIIFGKTFENEGLVEVKKRVDDKIFKFKKEDIKEFLRKEIYDY
ncbi:MAG: proline--tRNA ligase [Caldisericia bacterium]|nr:proline--tRNA ligase [Caldisericia bacterium]